jgi:hypothetical protein
MGLRVDLRTTCYLNDNGKLSYQIFASFGTNNIHAYEFFKKFAHESWVNLHYSRLVNKQFYTYLETEELTEKANIEFIIEKINRYYRLPTLVYEQFRMASGLSIIQSCLSLSMFKFFELKEEEKLYNNLPSEIAAELQAGFINSPGN